MTDTPAMLAIIAKAEFAKLEKSFGIISPGTTVTLDRYLSRKPAFEVLKDGGALYLVTVRPKDEQLWLVAVLENPTAEPDMWRSAPNRVPVADITALIPKLKFTTGTGISAKKGALGMSLQTPRQLTDGDIALISEHTGTPAAAPVPKAAKSAATTAKTTAKPTAKTTAKTTEKPTAKTPTKVSEGSAAAEEKLSLEAVLEALNAKKKLLSPEISKKLTEIVANAAKAPSKVVKELKALAKQRGDTEEIAAAWDAAAAAILTEAKKGKGAAGDCHGFARIVERALGTEEKDITKRMLRDAVFASEGALWMKELTSTLTAGVKSTLPNRAELAVRMAVDTVAAAGEEPKPVLLKALSAYGKTCTGRFLVECIKKDGGKGFREASPSFWNAVFPDLREALRTDDFLVRWVATYLPYFSHTEWFEMLLDVNIAERFSQVDRTLALPCLELAAGCAEDRRIPDADMGHHLKTLCALLHTLAPLVKAENLKPIDGKISFTALSERPWVETRVDVISKQYDELLNFEVLDVLISHGLEFEHRSKMEKLYLNPTFLWFPHENRPSAQLSAVAEHPIYGLLLELSPARFADNEYLERLLEEAGRRKGMRKAIAFLDGRADPIPLSGDPKRDWYIQQRNDALQRSPAYQLRRFATEGTVGGLEHLLESLSRLMTPAIAPLLPNTHALLQSLDPVALYCGQLRAGLLDEFGDVRCERLLAAIVSKEDKSPRVFYDDPNIIVIDGDRLVVETPDGIVIDKKAASVKTALEAAFKRNWRVSCFYFENDVLIYSSGKIDSALGKHPGKSGRMDNVKRDLFQGGLLRMNGKRIASMEDIDNTYYPHDTVLHCFWYDSEHTYVSKGNGLGTATSDNMPLHTHCIGTGERLKKPQLPSFFAPYASRENRLLLDESKYTWVQPGVETTPMPAKDGLSAFVCYFSETEKCFFGETVTGLKARSTEAFNGIIRFPYRDCNYLCYRYHITMENGIALIPKDQVGSYRYWANRNCRMGRFFEWNDNLVPRDFEGSKALSTASVEQARIVFEAATAVLFEGKGAPSTGGEEYRFNEMMVTVNAKDEYVDPHAEWPTVTNAVKKAFPEISDGKLVAGVARAAVTAVEVGLRLDQIRRRVADMAPMQPSEVEVDSTDYMADADVYPLDPLLEAAFYVPGKSTVQLERHVREVSAFLFPENPCEETEDSTTFFAMEPADCHAEWERCLVYGGEFLYQLLAPATRDEMREALARFCTFYKDTALAAHTDRLGIVGLTFAHPPIQGISAQHKDFLVKQGGRRLLLRCLTYAGPWTFACLHAEGNDFQLPPGAEKTWEASFIRPLNRAVIEKALLLLKDKGPFLFSKEAALALSDATGMLYGTAAMVLSGCAYHKVDAARRKQLDASADDINYGKNELGWDAENPVFLERELHEVISKSLPEDLTELYTSPKTFAERLAANWREKYGVRAPLDVQLIRKLEDDLRDPHPNFITQATALVEGDSSPQLTGDVVWAHRPWRGKYDGAELRFSSVPKGWPLPVTAQGDGLVQWPDTSTCFSYEAIYLHMKLIAWANLELEVGHPLREKAALAASLIEARLSSPGLLLPIGTGPIKNAEAFWNFVKEQNGAPYRAPEGESAEGIVAGGLVMVWPTEEKDRNGVLLSLATGQLTDREARQTLLKLIESPEGIQIPGADINAYPYWHNWRLWQSDDFQSLIAELKRTDLAAGAFVANPAVSAPETLKAVQQNQQLSTEAAMLYLQVSALGEPSAKRVMRYNGWKKATYENAVNELVEKQRVVNKKYKTATHTLFLPGDVAYFDRYPAPVETAKLSLLGLVEKERPPLGVPLNPQSMRAAFERVAKKTK